MFSLPCPLSSLGELLTSVFPLTVCSRQGRLFHLYFSKFLQPPPITQFPSHFHILRYLSQQQSTSSYQNLCQSRFNQRSRISKRYILKDLLQRTDLHDWGSWQGKSKIHRAGLQEGQAGIP